MHVFFSHACLPYFFFFFFNDTATTEIYTLSLHDALPIYAVRLSPERGRPFAQLVEQIWVAGVLARAGLPDRDRKSTRLNSSHGYISYAVFCLKKKKKQDVDSILLSSQLTTQHGHRLVPRQ